MAEQSNANDLQSRLQKTDKNDLWGMTTFLLLSLHVFSIKSSLFTVIITIMIIIVMITIFNKVGKITKCGSQEGPLKTTNALKKIQNQKATN